MVVPTRGGLGVLAGFFRRSHLMAGPVDAGASDAGGVILKNQVSWWTMGRRAIF
jgi:hypothetical protein